MSPLLNRTDFETACSQPFSHLRTVHSNLQSCATERLTSFPACSFAYFQPLNGINVFFGQTTSQSSLFFPFCTTCHIKPGGFLKNTALLQHCIHIFRQWISKSDAQTSRWNGEFSISGGRWITPASDSFILGANILPIPTFIIFRSGSMSSLWWSSYKNCCLHYKWDTEQ